MRILLEYYNMAQVVKYAISTKPEANGIAVRTVVEVDFENFTLEDAKNMFFKSTSPRVAVQSALRNAKGGIPARWVCKATDFAKFGASTGERILTPDEMLDYAKQNPEYMELLKKQLGL